MELIDFLNTYWKEKSTGKYQEPSLEYIEEYANYFGGGDKLFLYFLLLFTAGSAFAKKVKWEHISEDFSNIYTDDPTITTRISLPHHLASFLRATQTEKKPTDPIFDDTEIPVIEDSIGALLFINGKYGNIQSFPQFYEEITKAFQSKNGITAHGQTRLCLDAWNKLEIGADGSVAPCCFFSKIWHINKPQQMNDGLRHLRSNLLNGRLNYLCEKCLSKPVVSTEVLINEIQKRKFNSEDNDPLSGLPLEIVNVGVTELCNLRCTYCSLSDSNYAGSHMSAATFNDCLQLINQTPTDAIIEMYGHGELTFHPQWKEYCNKVLATDRRIHAITNLATALTETDYDVLAKFYTLWVSLDSNDEEMMKTIRRKVSPGKVFEQVKQIQAAAKRLNIPGPKITFSVGVYNPSIWTLDSFMHDLVALKIQSVVFWDLIDIPLLKNATASRLIYLDDTKTKVAKDIYQRATNTLNDAHIEILGSNVIFANNEPEMPIAVKSNKVSVWQRLKAKYLN